MNIDSILKATQKVMCNNSLYQNREYFYIPHKKILMAILKDITKQSYQQIGIEFKKTWFAIYKDCKDVKDKHKLIYSKILERVRKEL